MGQISRMRITNIDLRAKAAVMMTGALSMGGVISAIFVHTAIVITVYSILYLTGVITILPTELNLLNWDGDWYDRIRDYGYYYFEGRQSTLAFFPLFPLFWKWASVGTIGISIINYVIFCISFYYLAKSLNLNFKRAIIFMSTPSLFFCMLPYSEALFFMGSVLILLGFQKNLFFSIFWGILLCSFTRSVNVIFIPTICFTYIITKGFSKENFRHIFILSATIISAAIVVFYIQYLFTGEWFLFFDVQKHWNRSFHIPTFPLTTLTGYKMIWLDGLALFFCVLAGFHLIKITYGFIFKKRISTVCPAVVFSMTYLVLIGLVTIFFSGIWSGQEGTSLLSLNRVVFAVPYFIVFLNGVISTHSNKHSIITFSALFILTSLSLGAYKSIIDGQNYLMTVISCILIFCYTSLYLNINRKLAVFLTLYGINFIFQIILYSKFLHYGWVG